MKLKERVELILYLIVEIWYIMKMMAGEVKYKLGWKIYHLKQTRVYRFLRWELFRQPPGMSETKHLWLFFWSLPQEEQALMQTDYKRWRRQWEERIREKYRAGWNMAR